MQRVSIERTNGNVVRPLAGEDHISGFLFYNETLPSGFSAGDRIKAISSLETAASLGITADVEDWGLKVLHYHLSNVLRLNPDMSLYVGVFEPATETTATYTEVATMQNYTNGRLRQIAVWDGRNEFTAADITALTGVADTLAANNRPLSIGYAPKIDDIAILPATLAVAGQSRVSVIIAQDGEGIAAELYADVSNQGKGSVSAVGHWLGIVSKARVNESIAWVEPFATGITEAAFGDGSLYRSLDSAIIETLDNGRYIFGRTYEGLSGVYFNDSHTMDVATSDYAFIENVRTMDKAVRGIYAYVLPKLGSPLKVDAATGKLMTYVVEDLQITANRALQDMERADEISGYVVDIDPDQNVVATSMVDMVIRKVDVGVMRHLRIKIGNATSL